ncbi:MAG: nitroreductase family protein [Bacteroidales bacterium]|nr:nitroreductase family protein [Bacteroidales bacterium]
MDHIHKSISNRYSTVIFSSKEISLKQLNLLLEAARWAPSSYNEQPWRFIIGTKGKNSNYKKIYDCLFEANQNWAKYAPVLMLSIAHKYSSVTGKINRFAQYDTGMAMGNLLTQATEMNLFVHQMGGYDVNKIRKLFNLDDKYEPMAAIAIGYKGNSNLFPTDLKERESRERYRNSIDEFIL